MIKYDNQLPLLHRTIHFSLQNACAIFLILAISGCSTSPPFRHDTKSHESDEYYSDAAECKIFTDSSAPADFRTSDGFDGETELDTGREQEELNNTYCECMRNKGWYIVDNSENRIDYALCSSVVHVDRR